MLALHLHRQTVQSLTGFAQSLVQGAEAVECSLGVTGNGLDELLRRPRGDLVPASPLDFEEQVDRFSGVIRPRHGDASRQWVARRRSGPGANAPAPRRPTAPATGRSPWSSAPGVAGPPRRQGGRTFGRGGLSGQSRRQRMGRLSLTHFGQEVFVQVGVLGRVVALDVVPGKIETLIMSVLDPRRQGPSARERSECPAPDP